jgi:DNA-binding beta-propeller fold protein YncE
LAILAAAAVVAGACSGGDDNRAPKPEKLETERIRIGRSPIDIAAGDGSVWVVVARAALRLDSSGRVTARVPEPEGADFRHIAVGGGSAWIADLEGEITRLDARTGQKLAQIEVGEAPLGIAADGRAVWVTRPGEGRGEVVRIDPRTNRVAARIELGHDAPGPVAVAEGSAWVVNTTGRVFAPLLRIGPRSRGARGVLARGGRAGEIAAAGRDVWVSLVDGNRRRLVHVDASSGRPTDRRISVPANTGRFAVDRRSAWTVDDDGDLDDALQRIDLRSGRIRARAPVGASPSGVALTPGVVWVASLTTGTVSRVRVP